MENVYVYSFSLDPENHQPTGVCNFSEFNDKVLQLTFDKNIVIKNGNINIYVFARNYNVLRINKGKPELLFAV
jgi:hypothetical protein